MAKVRIEITGGDNRYMPFRAHEGDAAFDLRACFTGPKKVEMHLADGCVDHLQQELVLLRPGSTAIVPAGFKMALEPGYEAQIRPRSGNSIRGLRVANAPGTIDSGYRGEVCVILYNAGQEPISIRDGDKIAQMVIQRLPDVELEVVEYVSENTERGADGFGSTGTV